MGEKRSGGRKKDGLKQGKNEGSVTRKRRNKGIPKEEKERSEKEKNSPRTKGR